MERIRAAIQKARETREGDAHGPITPTRGPAATATYRPAGTQSWGELEPFKPRLDLMAENRIVTFDQKDKAHVPFDMMRTQVLSACRKNNWKVVGITSPTPACGKTVTAINLAFSFARQKDTNTVLMDVDLRKPMVANNLGISTTHSMGRFLSGEEDVQDHTDDVIAFLPNIDAMLLVAAAGTTIMKDIDDCERELSERINVMGVVLNKCDYIPENYGYGY